MPLTRDELKAGLRDPRWRLDHLYSIINKEGQRVPFRMNAAQRQFMERLWTRNVVSKARQLGYSSVTQLTLLDRAMFVPDQRVAVVAQSVDVAASIFRDRVRYAYAHMPAILRDMVPLERETSSELEFRNGSIIKVTTSARGSTLNALHVSEYAAICRLYPERGEEVLTGSIPAVVPNGLIVVESTARGREGHFFDMVMRAQALQQQGKTLTPLDFKLHFSGWQLADEYELDPEGVVITPEDHKYFDRVEAETGIPLGPRKRAWYCVYRASAFGGDRERMAQEMCSTVEEAFAASTEGLILADQLAAARREGRIGKVPYDPSLEVVTSWDLGLLDDRVVWFLQQIHDNRWNVIDFLETNGEAYIETVRHMMAKGYRFGEHLLPHDAGQRRPGAEALLTDEDMLRGLGLRNLTIVPRIAELGRGIDALRQRFTVLHFDEERCTQGLRHLGLYRREWDERHGIFIERPAKNGAQHAADALRMWSQHTLELPRQYRPSRRNRVGGMAA